MNSTQQPFEHYVEQMLQQQGQERSYTSQQIRYWLIRLAQEMTDRHLDEFSLTDLQLSWLQNERTRMLCAILVGFILSLLGGLLFALAGWLFLGPGGAINAGSSGSAALALLLWRDYEVRPRERITWAWQEARRKAVSGMVSGMVLGMLFGLISSIIGGLQSGIVLGLLIGLVFGLILALIMALVFGSVEALEHATVRFILWQRHIIPWHYAHFLEEATSYHLLQRVDDEYRFVDPLLQSYFASFTIRDIHELADAQP